MVAQHKVERKSSPAQYALQGEGHVAPKSSRDLYYALVNFYQNEQPFFSREGNIVTSYMGEASTAPARALLAGPSGMLAHWHLIVSLPLSGQRMRAVLTALRCRRFCPSETHGNGLNELGEDFIGTRVRDNGTMNVCSCK